MLHRLLLLIFSFYFPITVFAQLPVAAWHLDDNIGLSTHESLSNTPFIVHNDFPGPNPEWLNGTVGNALRFNGYATWVEGSLNVPFPTQQLTITAWVAAEVYPVSSASFFTNVNSLIGGGVYLGIDNFGRLEIGATVNGFFTKKISVERIPISQWVQVAMTVDGINGKMRGYINGVQVSEQSILTGPINWANPNSIKIGKHQSTPLSGIYETGLFCGLIDEVQVFDLALNQSQLAGIYAAEMPSSFPDLAVPESRFSGDPHRPVYHAIPPANWMNEPHGLIYHDGLYHIFYQKNGNGPYWGRLNWGHQSSPDLVSWTEHPVVLSPDPNSYDKEGCWSGCSIEKDGKAYIVYTGVDGATAQICLAEANPDLSFYQKYTGNPVILNPPPPYTSNDFRDPYVWSENGFYYLAVGTGTNNAGAALLYKSSDLITWEYLHVLQKGNPPVDNSGSFWELPMFLNFQNQRVMVAQPVPAGGVPARILYWTGAFQNEFFVPDASIPKQLEPGDALLGVTTTRDPQNQLIAIGIIPDILPNQEQRKNGWANTMSLPRVWSLSSDGKTLLQKPLPALQKLRSTLYHKDLLSIPEGQNNLLPEVVGRHLEIQTTLHIGTANRVGIVVAKSDDNQEYTRIYWDKPLGILVIDRSHSSINSNVPSGFVTATLPAGIGDTLGLHLFLDGSVLEVFINDEQALSTRIYPEKPTSIGVDGYVQAGAASLQDLNVWTMKNMHDLPVGTVEILQKNKNSVKAYPIPFDQTVQIQIDLIKDGALILQVIDSSGRFVAQNDFGQQKAGLQSIQWKDNVGLPKGQYIGVLILDNQLIGSVKLIK